MGQSNFTTITRELRNKARYTQADVSRMLNIQRQTYCNYENDLREPPLEIVIALAELYHVSVDYLVRGVDKNVAAPQTAPLNQTQQILIREFSSLPENSQREVLDFIHFKKQFSD